MVIQVKKARCWNMVEINFILQMTKQIPGLAVHPGSSLDSTNPAHSHSWRQYFECDVRNNMLYNDSFDVSEFNQDSHISATVSSLSILKEGQQRLHNAAALVTYAVTYASTVYTSSDAYFCHDGTMIF